ncbi:hypothetical protein GCM10009733_112050 [Nonomuraea maheshkhaliensis]|uniref:CD225/dispanin family protein n=1 Tax=Nonomuraea maheshkhaliensis TaxID=419590 RepID=A0ABP4U709_9ACTN
MTPGLWVVLLIAVVVAYTLGTYRQAARDAHDRFVGYRHRVVGGFTTWIKDLVMYGIILAGVAVVLYLLIR